MKSISFASLPLVLALAVATSSLLGCGKKDPDAAPAANTGAPAANTGSPGATGAATGAAAAAADEKPVLGTCNDKSVFVCREYYGVLPLLAEDLCKGLEGKGVLTKGSTPCAKENLVGTCEIKGDEASERWYYYKQPDVTPEMNKMACEILGKWTPAKGAPAAAATGAAPASTGGGKGAAAAPAPAKPAAAPKKRR